MSDKESTDPEEDLDDELERQWEAQDLIHKKCKMKDDPEKKLREWKEKYG